MKSREQSEMANAVILITIGDKILMMLEKERNLQMMVPWKLRSKICDLSHVWLVQRAIAIFSSSTSPNMSMQDSGGNTEANLHNCGQHRISQLRDVFSGMDPSPAWIV